MAEAIERDSDIATTLDIPLSAPVKTSASDVKMVSITGQSTTEESGAQSEGPRADVV